MKDTKIVVLDFINGKVIIDEYDSNEIDAECYITDVLELDLVQVEYMSGKSIEIEFTNEFKQCPTT
jgi:hypothetical protein